jgi:hypothetical protein
MDGHVTAVLGHQENALQVRIHFCRRIKHMRISFGKFRLSANMDAVQPQKIDKASDKVHPALQFGYNQQMSHFQERRHNSEAHPRN